MSGIIVITLITGPRIVKKDGSLSIYYMHILNADMQWLVNNGALLADIYHYCFLDIN